MDVSIAEIYLSIQGESSHAGWPCVLVRTAGCPLRCSYCDTAWAREGGTLLSVEQIVERACEPGSRHVEVTGGEPLHQAGTPPLLRALCDRGKTVLLETSGAMDISGVDERVHIIMDIKCPGSGMADRTRWENLDLLRPDRDEVKLVVGDRADYEFARRVVEQRRLVDRCTVLLSTVAGRVDPADVVAWMLDDRLDVRFQLQMHKVIWPERSRGV